jgi:hypothetical protein
MRNRTHVDGQDFSVVFDEIIGGIPQSGNAPEYALWREQGPNNWWNAGGPAWVPAQVWNPLPELDPINRPGFYSDELPAVDVFKADIGEQMLVLYRDVALVIYEHEYINVLPSVAGDVWGALEADHTTADSFGVLMKIIAGLGFRHYKQYDHVYNANGQLTSCTVRVYATNADLIADTPLITLDWTTSYVGTDVDTASATT